MFLSAVATVALLSSFAHSQPWRDPTLPVSSRVADLISRLNVTEKAMLLGAGSPALPRLGLPSFSYARECERGDSSGKTGTAFPSGAALAATWDPELIYRVARATAVEARANANAHGGDASCFGPVLNYVHDARWGRTAEMLGGEDTTLGSVLGAAFVRGLQSYVVPSRAPGGVYRAAVAIPKHLNVYSGPEGHGFTFGPDATRFSFNANLTTRADREFFLPQYAAAAAAGAAGFMCSYSAVTGPFGQINTPACASHALLTGVLREEWAFDGFVLSDAGAVAFVGRVDIGGVPFGHGFVNSDAAAAVAALEAGCDVELTCCGAPAVFATLPASVAGGSVREASLDTALARALRVRFELGVLDAPEDVAPFSGWGDANVSSPAAVALAGEAAAAGVVVLKNAALTAGGPPLLPLSPDALAGRTVAVLGPLANDSWAQMGGYVNQHPAFIRTPWQGIVDALPLSRVLLDSACEGAQCPAPLAPSALALAASADVLVVVLGTTGYWNKGSNNESAACGCPLGNAVEGECCDRSDTALPGQQLPLLKALAALGKPLVLVLCSGGSLDVAWPAAAPTVHAILHAPFLGMAAGTAVAGALLGVGGGPSARTTLSWYEDLGATLPPLGDYTALYNSTYRYADPTRVRVTFPFGHGLGFAEGFISYGPLMVSPPGEPHPCAPLTLRVTVANGGDRGAYEVVQAYGSLRNASVVPVPRRQLLAFAKVWVPARGAVDVELAVAPGERAVFVGADARATVEPGVLELWVGSTSDPAWQGARGATGRVAFAGAATPVAACP